MDPCAHLPKWSRYAPGLLIFFAFFTYKWRKNIKLHEIYTIREKKNLK